MIDIKCVLGLKLDIFEVCFMAYLFWCLAVCIVVGLLVCCRMILIFWFIMVLVVFVFLFGLN